MRRVLRLALLVAATAAVAALVGLASPGKALAYGAPDQPLAQIELSANCNNPSFPLCQVVGLGGIWLWVEIDSGGTADVAGAVCGHELGGGGGGAGSIRGEFGWTSFSGSPAAFAAAFPNGFLFGVDPGGQYYVLGGFDFGFPKTVGHYSAHPVPGVAIELTVAP